MGAVEAIDYLDSRSVCRDLWGIEIGVGIWILVLVLVVRLLGRDRDHCLCLKEREIFVGHTMALTIVIIIVVIVIIVVVSVISVIIYCVTKIHDDGPKKKDWQQTTKFYLTQQRERVLAECKTTREGKGIFNCLLVYTNHAVVSDCMVTQIPSQNNTKVAPSSPPTEIHGNQQESPRCSSRLSESPTKQLGASALKTKRQRE